MIIDGVGSLCNRLGNRSKAITNGPFGVMNDGKGRDGRLCEKFEGSVGASVLVFRHGCNLQISGASIIDSLLSLNSLKMILVLLTRSSQVSAIL